MTGDPDASETLRAARERFEGDLDAVRGGLADEWGWTLAGGGWLKLLLAAAVGFAAGAALRAGGDRLAERNPPESPRRPRR